MGISQKRTLSKDEALMVRSNMRRIRETTVLDGDLLVRPLSLRKMADKLGTNSAKLSRFETGKNSPFRHEMVMKYANVLGVPIHLFYQRHTRRKPTRLEADLLDISNRRYEELAQSLKKTQEALRKTQRIVEVQTMILKEQAKALKTVQRVTSREL